MKALRQLYGALSALGVDYDTRWGVLARIALDCAPAIRVPLMLALLNETGWRRTAVIAEAAELVTKTAARHLDDLTLLGIAERTKKKPQTDDSPPDTSQADNSPHYWQASQWLRTHWPQVGQRTTTKREEELKDAATGPPDSTPFGSSLSHLCGLNERPRGAD